MKIFSTPYRPVAWTIALGLTVGATAPMLVPTTAQAQFQPSPSRQTTDRAAVIPAGTRLPVEHPEADKIVVAPNEILPVTLLVTRDISSTLGTVLIPAGSEVSGQIEPTGTGSAFVADELILRNDDRFEIDATSKAIAETEEITEGDDTDSIVGGALIGAVAGSLISEVIGDIDFLEVLLGAGVGAAAGAILDNGETTEVIVIQPMTDLTLTLNSDLVLR
ncbi:MAG: hypothetical protein SWY16_01805 [Cyanobacteriota bacterium]|nr:hypothetical protein [Cyanobacteriota bacterium]